MKFRSLLCSVLASTMVIGSCVCANAATFTAGSENATAGNVVSVPITVAPSAGETSTDVNAYAIAISYDSSVLTPVVKGTDEVGDNTYATVGDSFNSGVLTADLKDNETGNSDSALADKSTIEAASGTVTVDTATKVVYGDVDANGAIEAKDVTLVSKYVAGLTTFTDTQIKAADVDGNGSIEAKDATLIAKYVAGLISTFPVEE